MKSVLFVVSVIAIFSADSRDFPDKPDKGDFAVEQDVHFSSNLADSDLMEELKGEKEMKLRGNAGKKNFKIIMKKLVSLDKKLTHANSEIKIEITDMNTELTNITDNLDSLNDGNSNLTQANSEMKIENMDIKKSLDSLKDGNTKLTQANSEMKIENMDIKKSLNSLKDGNTKLTQANSEMKTKLQAIQNRQGGALIGGQYFTFSKEKVSWHLAKSRCSSLNGRLAVLANPQAFHAYAVINYSGDNFWLGGSDISTEGTWTWINSQSFVSFPWPSGQPSNTGDNQDCLEWGYQNNYNDALCDTSRRYVCDHEV